MVEIYNEVRILKRTFFISSILGTKVARHFSEISRYQAKKTQQFSQLIVEPDGYVAVYQQGAARKQQQHRYR